MYTDGRVKMLRHRKSPLQDVCGGSPMIIRTAAFCLRNALTECGLPPQASMPYDMTEKKQPWYTINRSSCGKRGYNVLRAKFTLLNLLQSCIMWLAQDKLLSSRSPRNFTVVTSLISNSARDKDKGLLFRDKNWTKTDFSALRCKLFLDSQLMKDEIVS